MRIADLIGKLYALQVEYGNLPVYFSTGDGESEAFDVTFEEPNDIYTKELGRRVLIDGEPPLTKDIEQRAGLEYKPSLIHIAAAR